MLGGSWGCCALRQVLGFFFNVTGRSLRVLGFQVGVGGCLKVLGAHVGAGWGAS